MALAKVDEVGKYLQDLISTLSDDTSKKILSDFCQGDSPATGPNGKGRVPKSLSFDEGRLSRDSDSISTFSENSMDRDGSSEELGQEALSESS